MKKTIAKEFLIFISLIFLSIMTFPITYAYNLNLNRKKDKLEDSIKNTSILWEKNYLSLREIYEKKVYVQNSVFQRASDFYSNVGYNKKFNSYSSQWENMTNAFLYFNDNEVYNVYKNFIKYYNSRTYVAFDETIPTNGYGLKNFLFRYSINQKDIDNYNLSKKRELYRNEIQKRINLIIEQMLDRKSQIMIALYTFLFLFGIAFLIRYLFIAIKWSIEEIKS